MAVQIKSVLFKRAGGSGVQFEDFDEKIGEKFKPFKKFIDKFPKAIAIEWDIARGYYLSIDLAALEALGGVDI